MRAKYTGPAMSYGFLTENGHLYFEKNKWVEIEKMVIKKLERINHKNKCCFQFEGEAVDSTPKSQKKDRKKMNRSVLENELDKCRKPV